MLRAPELADHSRMGLRPPHALRVPRSAQLLFIAVGVLFAAYSAHAVTNLGASIGTALAGAVLISALTASFIGGAVVAGWLSGVTAGAGAGAAGEGVGTAGAGS
jgi:hypothetical protein